MPASGMPARTAASASPQPGPGTAIPRSRQRAAPVIPVLPQPSRLRRGFFGVLRCQQGSYAACVGRRLRNVGGLEGCVLLAEDGQDFLAEQVQLLKDSLQRQPRVVDQEQLALVVAEVLAEGQGL